MLLVCLLAISCRGDRNAEPAEETDTLSLPVEAVDTIVADTVVATEPEDDYLPAVLDEVPAGIVSLMESSGHKAEYASGIIPEIAKASPDYARKLINSDYDKFIVVDKARMMVILYDHYGRQLEAYGMACAKNFGTKLAKADSRTPEGFFSIQGIYDSTDWLFTDDNGVTSPKKGQFGPRFIKLRTPVSTQIGIHGTCAPWSIGRRASHGCIRLTNENILRLVELVEPGMPVIVTPGKKDRKVNREEGNEVVYFPTSAKYAISEAERREILGLAEIDSLAPDTTISLSADTLVADTIARDME